MHLISQNFLFFFVIFFCVYFALARTPQKIFVILASYYFISYASLWMTGLLILSCVSNYFFSHAICWAKNGVVPLRLAVIANILLLAAFKYFNFFTHSLSQVAAEIGVQYSPATWAVVAPLGLSFYTFQAISYLVDIKRKLITPPAFIDFALYLAFWPKFIAGPIIRATWFLPQLAYRKRFKWANFYLGTEMIVYGLFLKVVLSDNLIPQIDKVFSRPSAYDGSNALVSAFFFTFQIYGDFAGYSLMVIGIARIMGYSVRRNFNRPNLARSFSDFWSRWHISLSSWLEDYVFRSLVPRRGVGSGQSWPSISAMYSSILNRPAIAGDDSFQNLSGDSLSYVEVALALETMLGELPQRWERLAVSELENILDSRRARA